MNENPNDSSLDTNSDSAEVEPGWPLTMEGPGADQSPEGRDDEWSTKKPNNHRTALFLVSCVAALGALYLFGLRHEPKKASAAEQAIEVEVDIALAKLLNESKLKSSNDDLSDTERIIQAFGEYPAQRQIAAEQLPRDPFVQVRSYREPAARDEGDGQGQSENTSMFMLTEQSRNLALQSILYCPGKSTCLINGEAFGQGQMVDDTFTVVSIKASEVELTARGMQFVLQLGQ